MRGADLGRLSTLPSDAEPPPHICQRETWAPVREEVVSLESPEVPTMRTDTQAAPPHGPPCSCYREWGGAPCADGWPPRYAGGWEKANARIVATV